MILESLYTSFVLVLIFQAIRTRYKRGLSSIPGPFIASISNIWKIKAVYDGEMPKRNIAIHEKFGPVVRIGPNHVSFASPQALKLIYTSRPSFPKSDFYKPTSPLHNNTRLFNLFSIQDVDYHANLKRRIASLYTKSAVLDLEPRIDSTIRLFLEKMSDMTKDGPIEIDMSKWLHLFAFDSLGDINLSKRFGFLESGTDVRNMINTADKILHMTGLYGQSPSLQRMQMNIKAQWAKTKPNPLLHYAIAQVNERASNPTKDSDILNSFIHLRNSDTDKVSPEEIAGAIYINLMAGHDVLAITLRAILYYLARYPDVMARLRVEIATISKGYLNDAMISYSYLSRLPYLDAVIHEALRIHANTGLILERIVPEGGVSIDGYYIPAGTVVGVNAWVIHRNENIFGPDVDTFKPERWLDVSEDKVSEMKRFIFSFGDGSRKCIGQNIAMAQAEKLLVEFLRRFDARLPSLDKDWHVHGSWVTKQTKMNMIVSYLEQKE